MTKEQNLEAIDEVLSYARQSWLDAKGEDKPDRMNKINELLDRRLAIMNPPEELP